LAASAHALLARTSMTISPRVLLTCISFVFATVAIAADPPSAPDQGGGAPQTVKVASAESIAAGAEDHKFAFVLIKSDSGECFAVAPPGGEGLMADDSYAVVAATGVSDFERAEMTKGRANCKVVDVVARVAK
jgi:hypothetical protein